jgi:hypothetical protein
MTTLYLTLGQSGGIYTGKPNSVTGSGTLHKESSGTSEALYQAASDASPTTSTYKVVVVGNAGSILLSNRNGLNTGTWTTVHTAPEALYGVAYGNGRWVAVGHNNRVVVSYDGTTWTESKGAQPGAGWNWITFGNGKFVAVGGQVINGVDTGVAMYSSDGTTWTKAGTGAKYHLQSVAYSPELNVFVAVGTNGSLVSVNG